MIHVQKTNKDAVDAVAAKTRPQHETDGNISIFIIIITHTRFCVLGFWMCVRFVLRSSLDYHKPFQFWTYEGGGEEGKMEYWDLNQRCERVYAASWWVMGSHTVDTKGRRVISGRKTFLETLSQQDEQHQHAGDIL